MCKSGREIYFCNCRNIEPIPYPGNLENENPYYVEYYRTYFVWTLNRYVGKKKSQMLGQMIMPVQKLDVDLSIDKLIIELCRKDIFDFKYDPEEGDELIIREEYFYKIVKGQRRPDLHEFMSLIYRDGCWQDDYYNVFDDKTRMFKKGVIKFNTPNGQRIL